MTYTFSPILNMPRERDFDNQAIDLMFAMDVKNLGQTELELPVVFVPKRRHTSLWHCLSKMERSEDLGHVPNTIHGRMCWFARCHDNIFDIRLKYYIAKSKMTKMIVTRQDLRPIITHYGLCASICVEKCPRNISTVNEVPISKGKWILPLLM